MSGKNYACANRASIQSAQVAIAIWPTIASLRRYLTGGTGLLLLMCFFDATGQAGAKGTPGLSPEVWQVIYDGESRVGYGDALATPSGCQRRLRANRMDTTNELDDPPIWIVSTQQMLLTSVEMPDGTVNEFSSQHVDGDHQTTLRGVRDGDQFKLELDSARPTDSVVMEGASALRGFFALEQSLAAAPLRAGDCRQLQCLFPLSNTPAEVWLRAGDMETTDLLQGEANLLRIRGKIRLEARSHFDFDCWQDAAGQVQKMHVPATHQTTFATTRDVACSALSNSDADLPDLGDSSLVSAESVAANPHLADQMNYTIRAERGTLSGGFPASANQTVQEQADGSLRICVTGNLGSRPPRAASEPGESKSRPPSAALYLRPNRWIESDDELIERMCRKVAAEELDDLFVARALTRHVSDWLDHKDYGRAWDSAAAVARSRRGDCTEHAVLTAALCRARGIPARIAFGLVYLDSRQQFGCHAWTEVWVDGEWVGLDATREQPLIGAGHIKVGDSHLSGTTAQVAMLPLTQLLSQGISIEVTPAEAETKN